MAMQMELLWLSPWEIVCKGKCGEWLGSKREKWEKQGSQKRKKGRNGTKRRWVVRAKAAVERKQLWEKVSERGGQARASQKQEKKRQKQVRNLGLTPKLSQRSSSCPWPQDTLAHPSQGWRELSVKDAAARPIQATPAVPIPSTNLAPGSQWNNLSTITASFDGHRARFLMCGTSGTPWFYGFVLFKIWKMLANYWGRFPCSAAKIITAWPRQGKHREASKHTLWVQGISGKHFYFNCWSVLRIYRVVGKLHECVCYRKRLKITYYFITVNMLLTGKAEYG